MKRILFTSLFAILALVFSSCQRNSGEILKGPARKDQISVGDLLYGDYIIYVYPLPISEEQSLNPINAAILSLHKQGKFSLSLNFEEVTDLLLWAPILKCSEGTYELRLLDDITLDTLINEIVQPEQQRSRLIGSINFFSDEFCELAGIYFYDSNPSISLGIPDGRFNTWGMAKLD